MQVTIPDARNTLVELEDAVVLLTVGEPVP